ncbi:translation initiation factor IF-2-like [Orycteropus afer afer]|uniref:Translation initiation factor IF-2-like n=1 Tax=Orycteropus afer afer TaxID=1230840 RepID=A0AC54ZAX1_ORYAF|nr:translation initiation factor IF-2-like [Orycteropus afer afer]
MSPVLATLRRVPHRGKQSSELRGREAQDVPGQGGPGAGRAAGGQAAGSREIALRDDQAPGFALQKRPRSATQVHPGGHLSFPGLACRPYCPCPLPLGHSPRERRPKTAPGQQQQKGAAGRRGAAQTGAGALEARRRAGADGGVPTEPRTPLCGTLVAGRVAAGSPRAPAGAARKPRARSEASASAPPGLPGLGRLRALRSAAVAPERPRPPGGPCAPPRNTPKAPSHPAATLHPTPEPGGAPWAAPWRSRSLAAARRARRPGRGPVWWARTQAPSEEDHAAEGRLAPPLDWRPRGEHVCGHPQL